MTCKLWILPLAFACCASAQPPSLIINGSFEDGPQPGSFINLDGGTTSIRGWIVTGESIDYIGGLWAASKGARCIDLDGSKASTITPPYAHGGIAQRFATKPGSRYVVTFDLAGNVYGQPLVKPLRVSAAGQSMQFSFNVAGKNAVNMGWRSEAWTFTANADTTTLEFRSLTTAPFIGWGASIDNVSVIEVPEDQPPPVPVTQVRPPVTAPPAVNTPPPPLAQPSPLEPPPAPRPAPPPPARVPQVPTPAAPPPPQVVRADGEVRVTMDAALLFDPGRSNIKQDATGTMRELINLIQRYPGNTIRIGATPAQAAAIRQWLLSNGGISPDRIVIAANDAAQRDRRVEIRLLEPLPPPPSPPSAPRKQQDAKK